VVNTPNLKYFLLYEDYNLEIFQKNYLGYSYEIFGSFSINKGSVETILEPIRGSGLSLELEANSLLNFDEFSIADESTYSVELRKNGQIIFNGFIKPDGIQQSFVVDEWYVNVEVIDGLGALKDLSFVDSNGLHFIGKMSMYDVIYNCLNRTGLVMVINSSVNIEYNGHSGSNILNDTYVNSSRFYKKDGETIMDCNEVLKSILNLFSAVITQHEGKWWIYRPNDLNFSQYTTFVNNTSNTTFTKNLNAILGSQIDNYYPHHCGGNQQIEMKGAISAYRLNYEYGFYEGFIVNKDLTNDVSMVFDSWATNPSLPSGVVINDPTDLNGLIMQTEQRSVSAITDVLTSISYAVSESAVLKLRVELSTKQYQQTFYFKIKTADNKYLKNDGTWSSTVSYISKKIGDKGASPSTGVFEFTSSPVLSTTTFEVSICRPKSATFITAHMRDKTGIVEINKIDVTDLTQTDTGIVGEFHTVSRKEPPSSITKENQTVYNGDSDSLFVGAIFKSDTVTLTDLWSRKNKFEEKPLLRISAEDDLRIQSNPIKIFSGDILGFIPYLSVVQINNISGLFMFTQYSYDVKSRVLSAKLTQFYNSDLGDISYLFSYDYGNNTIKPTII
jgi:hypothetical protein